MLTTIIVFGIKVYVYKKMFDAIEDVGKRVTNYLQKKKGSNDQIIETYFVD